MRLRHRLGHVDELLAGLLRVRLEQGEGGFGVDAASLHEDALGLLDDRAPPKGPLQVLELRKATQRDVESALQLASIIVVENDVGEDTPLSRLLHVARVPGIEQRDDRTRCLMDDRRDLLERVLAIETQSHERDLCARASTERPDISDVDAAPDDLMAESFDDRRDARESPVLLVGDQHL